MVDKCGKCADACCASACGMLAAIVAAIPLMGFTAPLMRIITGSRGSVLLIFYAITGIAILILLARFAIRGCLRIRRSRYLRLKAR